MELRVTREMLVSEYEVCYEINGPYNPTEPPSQSNHIQTTNMKPLTSPFKLVEPNLSIQPNWTLSDHDHQTS